MRTLIAIFMISFLVAGCVVLPAPNGEELPDHQEFKEVLVSFYNAEKSKDWKTYWSYFNRAAQEEMPYDTFAEYMSDTGQIYSYKVIEINNYGSNIDAPERITAQVEVTTEMTIKEGPYRFEINQVIDFWWRLDGKWTWVIRK